MRMSNESSEETQIKKRMFNGKHEKNHREKRSFDESHIRSQRYGNVMPNASPQISQWHGQAYIQRALIEITLEATAAS